MAFTFLSRFRVKPERDSEFVGLIPQMEANAASEPATLAYKFYRLDEPNMYGVFESFVDADGDRAHQANPASAAPVGLAPKRRDAHAAPSPAQSVCRTRLEV